MPFGDYRNRSLVPVTPDFFPSRDRKEAVTCAAIRCKSTCFAINNAQSSAKSFWMSIVSRLPDSRHILSSQPFDLGDALFSRAAHPVNSPGIFAFFLLKRGESEYPLHRLTGLASYFINPRSVIHAPSNSGHFETDSF